MAMLLKQVNDDDQNLMRLCRNSRQFEMRKKPVVVSRRTHGRLWEGSSRQWNGPVEAL
jgi:hypothetical protein